jgi:hypothetical protein
MLRTSHGGCRGTRHRQENRRFRALYAKLFITALFVKLFVATVDRACTQGHGIFVYLPTQENNDRARGKSMSDATSGQDTPMRTDAQRRDADADAQGSNDLVAVRHLRGATEYRGRRDALLSTGDVHASGCPERLPGQRMRATLRARDGGRDVFVRRLDDGRYCVLVIQTATERAEQEHAAFVRFMGNVLRRRG